MVKLEVTSRGRHELKFGWYLVHIDTQLLKFPRYPVPSGNQLLKFPRYPVPSGTQYFEILMGTGRYICAHGLQGTAHADPCLRE